MNEQADSNNVMKTGTTTIGIVCADGVILAADKRATSGGFIVTKLCDKILEVYDRMAVTTAGTVSDIQLMTKLAKAELKLKAVRTGEKPTVSECANLLSGLIYQNIRKFSMIPGVTHFILGGADEKGFYIYDLFADGSLTEVEDYVSSGSGSVIAYGMLEGLYKKDMTVDEGVKLAVRAISSALQRDTGSGGGIDVVTITQEGIKYVFKKELDTKVEA